MLEFIKRCTNSSSGLACGAGGHEAMKKASIAKSDTQLLHARKGDQVPSAFSNHLKNSEQEEPQSTTFAIETL